MTVTSLADRKAKQDEASARLATMLDALADTATFKAYLRSMAAFHRYSWANVAMIVSQRPTATRVNSYKRWQAIGRQVRQGEKGIAIWTPRIATNTDGDRELVGFGLGYVFDIAQTDGDALPTPPEPEQITGQSQRTEAAHAVLLDLVAARGVTFIREDTRPAGGYWKPQQRIIAVDETLTGNAALSVITHECAHMLADHHCAIDRSDAESVAEGVAFVVMSYLGVDTSGFSVPYIAGWARDADVLRRNLHEIQSVSFTMIEAFEDAMTDDLELDAAA